MLRMGTVRAMHIEGRKTGWREEHDNVYAASEAAGWDAESQVAAMDAEGLDLAVLYPSRGLSSSGSTASSRSAPMASSRVRDRHRRGVQRLDEGLLRVARRPHVGAGMVAPHDVEGAVTRARCVRSSG